MKQTGATIELFSSKSRGHSSVFTPSLLLSLSMLHANAWLERWVDDEQWHCKHVHAFRLEVLAEEDKALASLSHNSEPVPAPQEEALAAGNGAEEEAAVRGRGGDGGGRGGVRNLHHASIRLTPFRAQEPTPCELIVQLRSAVSLLQQACTRLAAMLPDAHLATRLTLAVAVLASVRPPAPPTLTPVAVSRKMRR